MAGLLPSIVIDTKEFITFIDNMEAALPVANVRARSRMRPIVPVAIQRVFIEAMDATDFPSIYRGHLLACVKDLPVIYDTSGTYLKVLVNLEELGTTRDLARGYHREALGDTLGTTGHRGSLSAHRVHLPYTGQGLYNEDNPSAREAFWEALVEGVPYDVGRGSSHISIPTYGMYDETLRNRVEVWGDQAPEWLLLEYGSHDGGTGEPPQIKPQEIQSRLSLAMFETCAPIFEQAVVEAIDNIPRAAGAGHYSRGGQIYDLEQGYKLRNIIGQYSSKR